MRRLRQLWGLMREAVAAWLEDYAPSMGAALSYYTMFSIAPLLVIVIAVAGLVFGREAAQGQVLVQLRGLIGEDGALAIQALLENAASPAKSGLAAIVGTATLLLGATTVFGELQSALDRIWRVPAAAKVKGLWRLLRTRLLSFGMILGLGFLLLVSLVTSAALAALGAWWGGLLAGWEVTLEVINFAVSFASITLLFALIYKFLPRAKIGWRDVWTGAAITSLLFAVGKVGIGFYLGRIGTASAFGAAGSLAVLLIWVYYSAQIFLLGAECTWVYAYRYGSRRGQAEAPLPAGVPSQDPAATPESRRSSVAPIGLENRATPVPSTTAPRGTAILGTLGFLAGILVRRRRDPGLLPSPSVGEGPGAPRTGVSGRSRRRARPHSSAQNRPRAQQ